MTDAKREMTLEEWCARLPEFHLVNRQLNELKHSATRPTDAMREALDWKAISETPPVRDECAGEQTWLTYCEPVGTFGLEFAESGDALPDFLGATHWVDVTALWPAALNREA